MAAPRDVERNRTLDMERQREKEKRQLHMQQWRRDFAIQVAGNAGFLPSVDSTLNEMLSTRLVSPTPRPAVRPPNPSPSPANNQRHRTAPPRTDIDMKPTVPKVLLFF